MKRGTIQPERILQSILYLRGQKVMLSRDLALLYGVPVGALTQAVKRNTDRFPKDFAFQLGAEEFANLKSQIVISSWGGLRSRPYAFTEQGVAMLSSILKSDRAVKVNIAIMRAFVQLRETIETNRELARRFSELEKRVGERTRLACWRWRPRHRSPLRPSTSSVSTFHRKRFFSASRQKGHASRVRSPIHP